MIGETTKSQVSNALILPPSGNGARCKKKKVYLKQSGQYINQ